MTTRDHLVYALQNMYSFSRDFLALLDSMIHECGSDELRCVLQLQHDGIKSELEPLERALNVLGAKIKMERSVLVPAIKETAARFKHQMNPSQEQLDVHSLLVTMRVTSLMRGTYQGDIELARAVGEQDIVTLLQENLHRQAAGLRSLQALASTLTQEVGRKEMRHAA